MALPPLATPEQLADRVSSTLPPANRVDAALADASAAVRRYTGQEITASTSTVRLKVVPPGVVRLPQIPVTELVSVLDVDGYAVPYVDRRPTLEVAAWRDALVDVTYTHGYDEVPSDVVAVVCNMAGRSLFNGPETAVLTQESITNYSASFGPVGASGPVGLFNAEKAVLAAYRNPVGPVWMAPA